VRGDLGRANQCLKLAPTNPTEQVSTTPSLVTKKQVVSEMLGFSDYQIMQKVSKPSNPGILFCFNGIISFILFKELQSW
jgi:hypothetical protein